MPPTRGRGRGIRGKQLVSSRGRQSTRSAGSASAEKTSTESKTKLETDLESESAMEEGPTDSNENTEATTEIDTSQDLAAGDDVVDEGSNMELEGTGEVMEKVTDEADASQAGTGGMETEPAHMETEIDEPEHKTSTDTGKKEETTDEQPTGSAVKHSNTENVTVISDDKESTNQRTETGESAYSAPVWQVRVYPVPFQEFCNMDASFKKMLRKSLSLEFRMSKLLVSKYFQPKKKKKSGAPWLPSNITEVDASSVGFVEMKVLDSALVDLIQTTRSTRFSKTAKMRFELKQLSKEEALHATKKGKDNLWKIDDDSEATGLTVKFAVQDVEIQGAATQQPKDVAQAPQEENYVFVRNIPDDVPDNVLQAVFMKQMVERNKGENCSGTATFDAGSVVGALLCIDQYDGILVNDEPLELNTKHEMFHDDGITKEAIQVEEAESQRILAAQKETIEKCKAEIINALPKTAISDVPISETAKELATETETETESAEKTKSENTSEEANITEGRKLEEASKEVSFPQSLKVKDVTETVNKFLSNKTKPPLSKLIHFPPVLFSDLSTFCPSLYQPYCKPFFIDCSKQETEEPDNAAKIPDHTGIMLMTTALQLEALAREQVTVSSFQDLATCALAEILSKSEMNSQDMTAMRSIVDGIHQSALVLGASAVVSVTNLRLDKRDSTLFKLPLSEKVKRKLRTTPVDDESLFERLEKQILGIWGGNKHLSGQTQAEQSAAKKQENHSSYQTAGTKESATSSSTSGNTASAAPSDASKGETPSTATSLPPTATSTEDVEMSSTQSSAPSPSTTTSPKDVELDSKREAEVAEMKACREEVERALLTSAIEENPEDDTSIQSHEILQLLKLINKLMSSKMLGLNSFIKAPMLPLPFQYQPDHYKTDKSFFYATPPKEEKELVALGIKSPHVCIRSKRFARILDEKAACQVALACFVERASYALKLLLDGEQVKSADLESLRCIVKGINRSAAVSLSQAIVSSTILQIMRRIAYSKKLKIDQSAMLRLKASPVGGDGLFGPLLTSIIEEGIKSNRPLTLRKERGQRFRSSGQASAKQAASSWENSRNRGSRAEPAGRRPKRLQGAYRGVSRRGNKMQSVQASSRGHRPAVAPGRGVLRGGSRGMSRGRHSGMSAWSGSNRNFSLGQQRRGSDLHAMQAGIQAQVQAAHRELVLLQQQAQIAQMQMFEEQGRLKSYQQSMFNRERSQGSKRARRSPRGGKPPRRQR